MFVFNKWKNAFMYLCSCGFLNEGADSWAYVAAEEIGLVGVVLRGRSAYASGPRKARASHAEEYVFEHGYRAIGGLDSLYSREEKF